MNKSTNEVHQMTDKQAQMLLEAIKIIVEKAESKEDALEQIERIKAQGNKKPQ